MIAVASTRSARRKCTAPEIRAGWARLQFRSVAHWFTPHARSLCGEWLRGESNGAALSAAVPDGLCACPTCGRLLAALRNDGRVPKSHSTRRASRHFTRGDPRI